MKLKTLSFVVAILAVANLAVFLVNRPPAPPSEDPRVGKPVADRSVIAKATRIVMAQDGKTVELAKAADGSWSVPSYYGFPADFSKLSQLVDELLKAKVDRFVSANPERVKRFGFDGASITVEGAKGTTPWALELGKATSGDGRLIRFKGDEKVFLSHLSVWLDSLARNWVDTTLVDLKAADIAKLELGFAAGPDLVLTRTKKGEPFAVAAGAPTGAKVDQAKVESLLGSAGSIRFSDTVPSDDPTRKAAAGQARTLGLTTFDGQRWTLVFSKTPAPAPKAPAKAEGKASAPAVPPPPPASPVFLSVTSSDPKATVNALMSRRAFEIYDYAYDSLPKTADELLVKAPQTAKPTEPKSAPAPKKP